jgi:hypothetical protein
MDTFDTVFFCSLLLILYRIADVELENAQDNIPNVLKVENPDKRIGQHSKSF